MSGNASEWCWDWYADYNKEPILNPRGRDSGTHRVGRGLEVIREILKILK